MRDVDVAYAAGFFDGEGHIALQVKSGGYPNLHVNITQNDRQPLEWFAVLFGGHIYKTGGKRSNAYKWEVNTNDAYRFLEAILPHLMVKRAEAMEACERWVERGS